jgi:threonine/homoserine/homoserine lactone efflux protein
VDLLGSLPAFVLAVLLISASPGPAMALILRRAALRGLAGAVPTVLGLELGLYAWALFAGVRVVGAAVLLLLGVKAWRTAVRNRGPTDAAAPPTAPLGRRRWWTAFGEGLVVQLANPKAAVFMIAFYPQFVPADGPVFTTTALLGLLQITLETALYLGLAAGVARAGAWFRRPRIRRRLDAVSGTVFIALGVRVAVSSR